MADILATLQRRSRTLILASTALVLVAVASLQLVQLRVARARIVRTAEARAGNLAAVLSEYVRGSFATIDATLVQLAVHSPRLGGAAAPADVWGPLLEAAGASLDRGSLSITDADGIIQHSTLPQIVGQSRRDNYVYKRLSTSRRNEVAIDRPFLTVTKPEQYILPLARPLRTADGAFDGIVVATVHPEDHREFFRAVDVGRGGVIWVFHPDGVVLFREPSDTAAINEDASANPVLQAAKRASAAGLITGAIEPGGRPFISAYHTIDRPSLVVGVSLDEAEVLRDWERQRRSTTFAFGLLALTLGGLVFVALRQMDARAHVEAELRTIQRLEAERLRSTNQQLENALDHEQQARRETEQASYMKDEFLMTVSHELRTPLNSIYGWVRLLGSDALPQDQRARAVAAIERGARAQARLIDDLLDVSTSITGKLRLDPRPTDVTRAVVAAVETSRPALEAKGLAFEPSIDPALPLIISDPDRLQQIVWNLLSNAIKFTPEGGTVMLRAGRADGNIEITVTDTGIGIEPDFMPFVFERFRQGEAGTRRRYGGLGLGLAIVRHLVELHGGTVTAHSEGTGTGTTVRVLIPARPPVPGPAAG